MAGNLISNFRESLQAQVDRSSLVTSDWIVSNFTHPRDDRRNWSWKDHEFQIDIADCDDREVAVIKPAQTGLSTLQIRLILAFLAQHDYLKAAYVLPTSAFAREFTQSRFNPAIESSPKIAGLVSSDTDNTSIKKIGSCFLILRGTSGTTSAISVDLDLLIVDELDFCSQDVLSSFSSRLQHSDLKLKRDFSTPTLPGFGISAKYAESSQAVRMVKHDVCGHWVNLSFFSDVVIPGFDQATSDFRVDHLPFVDVSQAWYKCPHCGHAVTEANLADPDKRSWVDKHPGHFRKGFRVTPWDLVKYNPLAEVLGDIRKYHYGDWVNFRTGLEFESADNSFMESVIDRNTVINPVALDTLLAGGYYGLFIGVDLGKVAHLVVGAASEKGLDILCAVQIDVSKLPDQNLGKLLVKLSRAVRCPRQVVDSMPDYSVALHLHAMNCGFGAVYGTNSSNLDIYVWDEKKGMVKMDRDLHFDDLAGAVNSGKIRFPTDQPLMKQHLSVMKKASVETAKGKVKKWVSTSTEDHFGHALGYCWAAYASISERYVLTPLIMPPSVGKVRLKT
jgi:hypothetical protein